MLILKVYLFQQQKYRKTEQLLRDISSVSHLDVQKTPLQQEVSHPPEWDQTQTDIEHICLFWGIKGIEITLHLQRASGQGGR